MTAAISLFEEQGYSDTTVGQIAERAGLTTRTFFRYFSDKREVLFGGSQHLERVWTGAVAAAAPDASPLAAAVAGFDPIAEMFSERHEFARTRAQIVEATPELKERELIKLDNLAAAIQATLSGRGVSESAANLAARAAVTVFHSAFAHWVSQDDPAALGRLMDA